MRDLFRFSIDRESDMDRRAIGGCRVGVVEFEEMDGRKSCNQILDLTSRERGNSYFLPV
jgi:hypothetical protein